MIDADFPKLRPNQRPGWPGRLHCDWGGIKADIGGWDMTEPFGSELLAAQHVLLGTLAGGGRRVLVQADGAGDWAGPKLAGAAGFFPGGRRMRSTWPEGRLTYLKLSIEPLATEELLHRKCPDDAWQSRPSAEDALISAMLAPLALAMSAEPTDRLTDLAAETFATTLHLHLVSRFSGLSLRRDVPQEPVSRVLDALHATLPQALSLSEMVEISGLPRGRFLAAFAKLTGYSPHQYILRERMSRARHLLETSRFSVSEVATIVGCANGGHLTRLYRNRYDSTPLAWRTRYGRL